MEAMALRRVTMFVFTAARRVMEKVGTANQPHTIVDRVGSFERLDAGAAMTKAVEFVLDALDQLSEDERRDAVIEILKRAAQIDYPPLSDEALSQIADELFQDYDALEAADAARQAQRDMPC
jgi:hypothetical protein